RYRSRRGAPGAGAIAATRRTTPSPCISSSPSRPTGPAIPCSTTILRSATGCSTTEPHLAAGATVVKLAARVTSTHGCVMNSDRVAGIFLCISALVILIPVVRQIRDRRFHWREVWGMFVLVAGFVLVGVGFAFYQGTQQRWLSLIGLGAVL